MQYHWQPGRYVAKPTRTATYTPGHWEQRPKGWLRVGGQWSYGAQRPGGRDPLLCLIEGSAMPTRRARLVISGGRDERLGSGWGGRRRRATSRGPGGGG